MNAYLLSNSYDLILYVSQLKTDKKTENMMKKTETTSFL